jgi:hypothetical protein
MDLSRVPATLLSGTVGTDSITNNAITTPKIASQAVTATVLHNTLDLTNKTVTLPVVQSSFGVNVAPSSVVPNSLQYTRLGRRYSAIGNMSGSTWINTGITFSPSNSFCFVLVDVLGHENGRNNGFRRYIMFYNIYNGWSTTGAIINNQHGNGNDYGLVDARYTSSVEIKAANNVSGGPYFLYATEYII